MPPDYEGRERWTSNGGRKIKLGDPLKFNEAAVTAYGSVYHLNSDCPKITAGWSQAYSSGKKPAGLYAVSKSVASSYVSWCKGCGQ